MKLDDLPQFEVRSIEATPAEGATLHGVILASNSVRAGRSWLYAGIHSVIGDLALDAVTGTASFEAPFWTTESPAQVGTTLPWIDGYWQAALVARILDPSLRWTRTTYQPRPAQYFRLGSNTGSQPAGGPLPDGATALHFDPVGWDHEHCEIWGEKIGRGGAAIGYCDGNDHWLCESCYARYASTHSLAFLGAT